MRHVLIAAAAGAALVLVPVAVMAQAGSTETPPMASNLKGPPNAAGYGTDTGLAKGSTVIGGAGSSADKVPSAHGMKGSPNADGYSK